MKKTLIALPFIFLLVFIVLSFGFSSSEKKKKSNSALKNSFAVVELFTSEGCSSCPPADEAVAALAKEYPSNVFVLGFHVDYWNNLGWKDQYSTPGYTDRQRQYASLFQLSSIYTPQVIVNGRIEFTGSDKSRLHTSVEKELNNNSNTVVELQAKIKDRENILVGYKKSTDNKSILHIVLVQLQAESAVKRGENKGKLLHHIDVVRNFKTVTDNTGSISIGLPPGLLPGDCKIVAFVQNRNDLHITGAKECSIR
ncbi:MAG: hypothetical protein NVSMB7_11380 [Chitinophagaceae bacterium]